MSADLSACLSSSLKSGPLRSVWKSAARGAFVSGSHSIWTRPRSSACFRSPPSAMREEPREVKEVFLDKEKFKQQLNVLAIRIPKEHSHLVSKTLSRFTLDRPRLKHVILDPLRSESRLVLLAEQFAESNLPEEKLAAIRELAPVEIVQHAIDLDYSYFSVEQVLKEILPEGCKVPASFETVGHIAHLNLTEELLPYKKVIAQVLLDVLAGELVRFASAELGRQKNQPKIKTIVNKVGTISNEFRVPTWEILAGDTNLVAEVRQQGATFRLDYGLVYWNSRLEFEHKRLPSQFQPGQFIIDMFAGIGPFAIPAAQKGCIVLANDLNPASVQYLNINAKLNKVEDRVHGYNMDARDFMKHIVKKVDVGTSVMENIGRASLEETAGAVHFHKGVDREQDQNVKGKGRKEKRLPVAVPKPWETFHHVLMNLPASALEFLDVFQGLLSKDNWKGTMPRIHCYCFMRAIETTSDVLKRAESILGGEIKDPEVWTVRDVAPNKIMLCLSFDLPDSLAFGEQLLPVKSTNSSENSNPESGEVTSDQLIHLQNKRLRRGS